MLVTFLSASIVLTLSPGPDMLMVISQSLSHGFGSAIRFVAGLLTGLCFHTLLLSIGWAQFIGNNPTLVIYLKYLGAIYFCGLGIVILLKQSNSSVEIQTVNSSQFDYYKGVVMNVMNPKVSLFFWLFFPGFLFHSSWPVEFQYFILGILFILQAGIVFLGVAFFSSTLKRFYNFKSMAWMPGVLWILIGLYLVFT